MNHLFCLIKFGKREHIQNLLDLGQMRFGAISDFAKSNEIERGDQFEGSSKIVNARFSKIEYVHPELGNGIFIPVLNKLGRIINYTGSLNYCFSSYAITSNSFLEVDNHKIDKRMIEFGEYALIIKEPNIFLRKVKEKLRELNYKFSYSLIEYIDFKQEGEIYSNLFFKTSDLKHQQEYRILIQEDISVNEIFIEIGSISEFCILSPTVELIETNFTAIR
jgi:hypothetical protein